MIVDIFNKTTETISAMMDANWVMAIATVVYVVFTGIIIYQNKINLRLQNTPYISSYFYPWKNTNHLEFIVENTGNSPAYNLHVSFNNKTIEVFKEHKMPLPEKNINYFPVGQKINHLMGSYGEFKKLNLDCIEIYLEYETRDRVKTI
jgi:hypothetical protein